LSFYNTNTVYDRVLWALPNYVAGSGGGLTILHNSGANALLVSPEGLAFADVHAIDLSGAAADTLESRLLRHDANTGVNLASTGSDADTGIVAMKTKLTAIDTKTTNLPGDPADDSDIDAQLATAQADLDNPTQYQSDGDTNTTTGITYAVNQRDAVGDTNTNPFDNAADKVTLVDSSAGDMSYIANNQSAYQSDGDTNTTTGITYAVDQRAAIGDTNTNPFDNAADKVTLVDSSAGDVSYTANNQGDYKSDGDTNTTTGITYAVDQRAAIGDTNSNPFDHGTDKVTLADSSAGDISYIANTPNDYKSDGDTNTTTGITYAVNQRDAVGDTNLAIGTGLDSATTSRILGRKMYGIAAGSGVSDDSTAIADRKVTATASIDSNVTYLWTDAQIDSMLNAISDAGKLGIVGDAADTILDHAPHGDNWSGSASGTGALSDTIYAIDTSGTDTALPSVWIQARNTSGTLLGEGLTNGSGYVVLGLPQSTDVELTGFLVGYSWGERTITTEAGTEDTDSLFGYNIDVGSPTSPNLKRVYGWEYDGPDSVSGLIVRAELKVSRSASRNAVVIDTAANVNYGTFLQFDDTTEASGYWKLDLPLNSNILPTGSTWEITCYGEGTAYRSRRWTVGSISLTNTDTECIGKVSGQTASCP
jgi:hypothetical protein